MFNRVLVGIDEQTRGGDAIALARRLAGSTAEITFGHVYPSAVAVTSIFDGGVADATAARALLVSVASESGVAARTDCEGSVSVSDGLHRIAERIGADLMVIGSTPRSRLTRALLGNFTADAFATADCTVAVAPYGYAQRPRELRRVGVAYDGSEPSEAALSLAYDLAESLQAQLSAFKVVPGQHDWLLPRRRRIERTVLALKAGRSQIEAHEGVEARVACGDPVKQLAGYSKTVDVLVAGARGAGLLARLLHPSTTEALTDVVCCPLVVVTRGARERGPEHGITVAMSA